MAWRYRILQGLNKVEQMVNNGVQNLYYDMLHISVSMVSNIVWNNNYLQILYREVKGYFTKGSQYKIGRGNPWLGKICNFPEFFPENFHRDVK